MHAFDFEDECTQPAAFAQPVIPARPRGTNPE